MTKNQRNSLYILAGLLVYHYSSFYVMKNLGSQTFNFIIKPIVCIGLSYGLLKLKKIKTEVSLKKRLYFNLLCVLAGVGYVGSNLALGTVEGFGKNPYDVSIKGIVLNVLSFYPYFLVLELLRNRLVNNVRKNKRKWIIILTVIVFTLLDFSPKAFSDLLQNSLEMNVEFLGSNLLPSLAMNAMLTQVVIMGGWIPALILKISYESMFYFFSVLPDLEWITKAFINILFPVFTVYMLMDLMDKKDKRISKTARGKNENPVTTIITYVLSIAIVWFSVGVFPIFPTLVLTGSMKPLIQPGDVVIMKRIDSDEIGLGDIIQFKVRDYDIIHRVIAIEESEFQTKGDNNNTPDSELVNPGFVKGKYMFHVPVVGRLTLYLKSNLGKTNRQKVEEEFELGSVE